MAAPRRPVEPSVCVPSRSRRPRPIRAARAAGAPRQTPLFQRRPWAELARL